MDNEKSPRADEVAHDRLGYAAATWQDSLPPEELLIAATRYYIGRRTIHAGWYAEHLAACWHLLPEEKRRIIRRDLEDEFRRDDYARLHWANDGKTYSTLPNKYNFYI